MIRGHEKRPRSRRQTIEEEAKLVRAESALLRSDIAALRGDIATTMVELEAFSRQLKAGHTDEPTST